MMADGVAVGGPAAGIRRTIDDRPAADFSVEAVILGR
jgi:hypothetical protein